MTIPLVLLFLPVGFGVGALHFTLLRRNTELLVSGGSLWTGLGLQLGRMAVTVAALAGAALVGWPCLLACAAGVLAARRVVVRRVGRAAP